MDFPAAAPCALVILPHALREKVGNRASVQICGQNVREIIATLDRQYPGFGFNICYETGELRPYVNIFVDRENTRYLQGLDTPVRDGTTIHILQSVAGG